MKTCSRCGQTKELDGFSKRSSRPSGVQSKCKDCEREVRRQYYKTHECARRRFKLTEDQYNNLMENENCQICDKVLDKKCIDPAILQIKFVVFFVIIATLLWV